MHLTADEAYRKAAGGLPAPLGRFESFQCPYCRAFTQQIWGTVESLAVFPTETSRAGRQFNKSPPVTMSLCSACSKESIFVNGKLIFPEAIDAPAPAEDLPAEIASDFEEARQIFSRSPRGAAALLRLAIQKLCPVIGATETDINKAIGELVSNGTVPAVVQQALDSVRVIGNEAVHPGTMDLKDDQDTAKSLFGLVNFIVEKAITEPKRIAEIYSGLPANKLAGIAQRDAKNPPK